ncbi:hypothetical protein GA0115255_103596 [Streptomyces sp. Ncost-T6T-2b]|nr:hypothetical protein GA0115255_103596 [Streptomyces sp. Ncost-T6T-2b]
MVLLTALPLWYRYVPVAVFPAALFVAVEAALLAARTGGIDRPATAGYLVVLAVCALAVTGGGLRLRARRRQRALALAAAGKRRFPLPGGVPESDGHRGHAQVYLGLALCLIGLAILTDGLVEDLTSGGAGYDAIGQQRVSLVLLLAGTAFAGWGQLAYRAARRLHEEDQPALIVGVRAGADGRHWVCADARTPSAPPLVAYVPRRRDTRTRTRLLGSGSVYAEGNGHHDIDPRREPFEAILYGTPAEGDEVVLEYACAEYHRYQEMGRMYAAVTHGPPPAGPPPRAGRLGAGGRRHPPARTAPQGPGGGGTGPGGERAGEAGDGGAPQEPAAPFVDPVERERRQRQVQQRWRLRWQLRFELRRLRGRLSRDVVRRQQGRRSPGGLRLSAPSAPLLRPVEDARLQVDLRVAAAEVDPADAVLQLEDVRGQPAREPLAGHHRSAEVGDALDG